MPVVISLIKVTLPESGKLNNLYGTLSILQGEQVLFSVNTRTVKKSNSPVWTMKLVLPPISVDFQLMFTLHATSWRGDTILVRVSQVELF